MRNRPELKTEAEELLHLGSLILEEHADVWSINGCKLAKAYLADHTDAGAELVTEKWRKLVGLNDPVSLIHWHLLTKRTARLVCADLGIPLKEEVCAE